MVREISTQYNRFRESMRQIDNFTQCDLSVLLYLSKMILLKEGVYMIKEMIIACYLGMTKLLFMLCKLFPTGNKTVLVSSFGDNVDYVAEEILRQGKSEVIILTSKNKHYSFDHLGLPPQNIIRYDRLTGIPYIKAMFHLATARVVFVDNYFAFLSVLNFKPHVKCVQLWHAAGAVKKFGMEDPTFYKRSVAAQKRFKNVYRRFDKIVVGADEMIPIFNTAFNRNDEHFLKTGIPRTDFFFNENAMAAAKQAVEDAFPSIKNKKVVLYAPTFRRDQLNGQEIALDIKQMIHRLGSDYVVVIRMHPAVRVGDFKAYGEQVIDASSYPNIHHLLVVTDFLISDYSSLPYEFALLNRPQIFYPYDLETYEKESGFWHPYESVVPGPVVYSTNEITEMILQDAFDLTQIEDFSKAWNRYSTGNASEKLIEDLY